MIELAKDWKEYVLLDAGSGEKLELWNGIKVVRPDPQAFWPKSDNADWTNPDMYYHRSKSGGGSWQVFNHKGKKIPEAWTIGYKDLRFHVRPTGFKHMGLFPEQAVNWNWLADQIGKPRQTDDIRRGQNEQPIIGENQIKVLNLFAYTGGATVACLNAGANVTHIDAAKGMNQQARENIQLSGLDDRASRVLTDDVLKFVRREARRGNTYDGIIMDPPVFGRGPSGEMWRLEERLYELVTECVKILSPQPVFMLINAYTAGFSPAVYANVLKLVTDKYHFPCNISVGEIGLAAKSGVSLPCGMYARAVFKKSTK